MVHVIQREEGVLIISGHLKVFAHRGLKPLFEHHPLRGSLRRASGEGLDTHDVASRVLDKDGDQGVCHVSRARIGLSHSRSM